MMTGFCCVEGCRNDTIFLGHSNVFRRDGVVTPGAGTTFGKPGMEDTLPVDALRPALGLLKSSGHSADDSFESENLFGLKDRFATLLVTYCCMELKKLIVRPQLRLY